MSKERSFRWIGVLIPIINLGAFVGLFLVLWMAGGCNEGGKGGMTEAELSRIAVTQKIELVKAAGGLVLMVGGEPITSDEIIKSPVDLGGEYESPLDNLRTVAQTNSLEQFKVRGRAAVESAVRNRIAEVLLYQEAKKQVGESVDESLDKAAEKELRRYTLGYGGDEAKADEALKKMGMNRKSFKERQKKLILIHSYLATKMPSYQPATYQELVDYYNRRKDELFSKPAMIKFRLIDIDIAKLDIIDPNQDRLGEARRLAGELVERIKSGEDFGALAQQYSHGLRKEVGGLWQPVGPDSLAKPYDVLALEAKKIEPGQIVGPIETDGHIFIMKLEEKQVGGYEPFEKVQKEVEDRIIYERRNEVVNKLNAKITEHAGLSRKDEFINFCLGKIYRLSKQ